MNTGTIDSKQVISAVQTMPLDELDKLVVDVLAARAERIAPHISGEESKLLRLIQKPFSKKGLLRIKELQTLRESGEITQEGFHELAGWIEKLEVLHAERLNAISELAKLRGITLQSAMKQVGLSLPDYE